MRENEFIPYFMYTLYVLCMCVMNYPAFIPPKHCQLFLFYLLGAYCTLENIFFSFCPKV